TDGERRTGLPRADDDRVVFLRHLSLLSAACVDAEGPVYLVFPAKPSTPAASSCPGVAVISCITTPSVGSTARRQGAKPMTRRVSSYPARQRARMPAGVKSMSLS